MRPRDSGYPDTGPCVVDDDPDRDAVVEQGLIPVPVAGIELFLDEDSGGPLRCRPTVEPCAALEGCVGAPVQVPIGTEATLAIGIRTITVGRDPFVGDAVFDDGSDPAFTVLLPLPGQVPSNVEEAFIFVAARPTAEGVVSARVLVGIDALNTPANVGITLQVEGVQP